MKKLAIIVTSILLGFGLAGCGGSSNSSSVAPNSVASSTDTTETVSTTSDSIGAVESHRLQDYYYITDVHMPNGKTLVCIEAYQYNDGGPTLSCNWEAFNKGLTP